MIARRARLDLLAGVQGSTLVVVLGGTADPLTAAQQFAGRFGPGPLVVGPVDRRPAPRPPGPRPPRWPGCAPPPPGPTRRGRCSASDLLPERALDGDDTARAELIEDVYEPLLSGGSALIETVTTYLEQGFSLEATARLLFVHPNTVRYRLRRVSELTGLNPSRGRERIHPVGRHRPRPPGSQANIVCRNSDMNNRPKFVSSASEWRSSTVQGRRMLVFAAPGQGAQTPGFLAPWLETAQASPTASPPGPTWPDAT